ncbi:TPA: hypothetical protein ACSK7Q_000727 [Listeria innocua]|uniref:hypothetical protein n=1 Tax=Listeria welshimeri TaxID=1643 RepID=UPI001623525A|nr:hypothetical protein [Listeria welshimeri]MBC2201052.1 hypothetical protein [Listeria welshimeri]MBF2446272.1 hypothetical protein [Listeria welshimeri]HDM8963452.1 hypothetical protein [Listeria innocua]
MKSLASSSTNNRQDYLSIRIPNKGDVPLIEYEGDDYGQLPHQGLESLRLLWVSDSNLETKLTERLSLDIVYIDVDNKGSRLCLNVGDSISAESNIAKIAEMNSEETIY